jgi:vacuolar iron transporter family protein
VPLFDKHFQEQSEPVDQLAERIQLTAAKSLVTVSSWWSSGLEMTVVGAVEGVVTYLIGIGLGHVGA